MAREFPRKCNSLIILVKKKKQKFILYFIFLGENITCKGSFAPKKKPLLNPMFTILNYDFS